MFLTEKKRWAGGERIRAAKERTASGKLLDHTEGEKNVGQCPLKGKKSESGRNGKKAKRKSTFFIFKKLIEVNLFFAPEITTII